MSESCPRCGAPLAQEVVRVEASYFGGVHVPQWRWNLGVARCAMTPDELNNLAAMAVLGHGLCGGCSDRQHQQYHYVEHLAAGIEHNDHYVDMSLPENVVKMIEWLLEQRGKSISIFHWWEGKYAVDGGNATDGLAAALIAACAEIGGGR